jgi:transposase InsO family protein
VKFLIDEKKLSERRAARLVQVSRTVLRYGKREDANDKLRNEIRRLSFRHRTDGYRMIYRKLRLAGWVVNHKRIERIYREEKLALRRKRRKKLPAHQRVNLPVPTAPNVIWSLDFISDATTRGRSLRGLVAVDDFSRKLLTLHMRHSIPGRMVVELLDRVAAFRGYPKYVRVDNGPEFRGRDFHEWAAKRGMQIVFIEPGKPQQNAFVESLNAIIRRDFLNLQLFADEADANRKAIVFQSEYNTERPHGSLGSPGVPPVMYEDAYRKQVVNEEKTLIQTGTKGGG